MVPWSGKQVPSVIVTRFQSLIAVSAVLAIASGCAPQPTQAIADTGVNAEGLQIVNSRYFSAAYARPGVDFRHYRGVLVEDVELAFRTPDRSQYQFPLDESQKSRFRGLLEQQFATALADLENLDLVSAAGADVIDLRIRVQDILATVPPRAVGNVGRASFALQAIGEATLVIELRDSQSEEVLVRVFDQRAIEGVGMLQDGQAVTRWEDVEKLCSQWASTVRSRLDAVVSGNY